MPELELAEHDPSWSQRFQAEASLINEALGECVREIEHVGSTAVPDLAAKPTVDIAVGVDTIELPPDRMERMLDAGFAYQRDDDRPWERRFVKGDEIPRDVI